MGSQYWMPLCKKGDIEYHHVQLGGESFSRPKERKIEKVVFVCLFVCFSVHLFMTNYCC